MSERYLPKAENLEKANPIIACVGTREEFAEQWSELERRRDKAHNVDFDDNPSIHKKNGFKNIGFDTYVISTIDDVDKFSIDYCNCTGMVVVGVDMETGKNVSFLSHQFPRSILKDGKQAFLRDLDEQIETMISRCDAHTIDVVIFGGNFTTDDVSFYTKSKDDKKDSQYELEYREMISLLSERIKNKLGFNPTVVSGPKLESGGDEAYFDTAHRRLYLMRPDHNSSRVDFKVDKMPQLEKRWKKDRKS